MGETKQINIKNRAYYFYNDMINVKDFDVNLLKIDKKRFWHRVVKNWNKKDYNEIDIYYTGYVTVRKIANCKILKV